MKTADALGRQACMPSTSRSRGAVAMQQARPARFACSLRLSGARAVPAALLLQQSSRRTTSQRGNALLVTSFAVPQSPPRPAGDQMLFDAPAVPDKAGPLRPLPRNVENLADDPSIHNPLKRMERLGTGWMGVIAELDGVVVEDTAEVHTLSWLQLADEEGKARPLQFALKRAEGMKAEQAIQEVFCWTRNPMEVRRLAAKKEDIFVSILGDRKPVITPGMAQLLDTLRKLDVPVAVISSSPEARVLATLQEVGFAGAFDAVLSAEDVYRGKPDPEGYLYASQQMGRPPFRCVVLGSSNQSIEAAHEVGMQCVVVAGRSPVYELTAADLVVRQLSELSFVNLKQLFRMEDTTMPQGADGEPELEPELEAEASPGYSTSVMTLDVWQ